MGLDIGGEGSHAFAARVVGEQVADEEAEAFGGRVRFDEHFSGSTADEDAGVGFLVVVGGEGVGDEDRSETEAGDFVEARSTGARDDEIGARVGFLDAVVE